MLVYIFAAPLLTLIGIALAPFAIIVTLVVRRITLSASDAPVPGASKCAAMAFTSSALMFLPWLYMVTRMANRHFSSFAIKAAYVLLYVRWAMSPIMLGPFVGISAMIGWRVDYPFLASLFLTVTTGGLAIINFAALIYSLRTLVKTHASEYPKPLTFDFPHPAYLRPLVYWLVLDMLTLFAGILLYFGSFALVP